MVFGLDRVLSGRWRVGGDGDEDWRGVPFAVSPPARLLSPSWRGLRRRDGGYAELMPVVDEFFGTSSQVCGGFWPFSTDMALPVEGVPLGRSISTGAGVCCDPISWFKAGIIHQPSMFVMGLPAIGKSSLVRRIVWGLAALGVHAIIPGDLKPDYALLTRQLGGQVIRLGSGIGSINPLDPGDVHYSLPRLTGEAREDLLAYYHERRVALLESLLAIARCGEEDPGRRSVSQLESDVLSVALLMLQERFAREAQPPVMADLRDLLRDGPMRLRTTAIFDDPDDGEAYARAVRPLVANLHGFANPHGRFGRLFSEQTTERMDLTRPIDFDISAFSQSGDQVVSAVLAATWSSAFAAKNRLDALAEAGLEPRRNHVIIMDEMHRALRASPVMVNQLDLLTRLNRQWGVGQIMITHTFADLLCLDTPAQNLKAKGFVERSEIKILGALTRMEVDKYLRGMSGLPVSEREESILQDWTTPMNFNAQASFKGLGKFLIKTGGLPGIPIDVQLCELERGGFNDTNAKW
ncbi:MAG: ATPase [Bifidobacterium crudilactis]|jgi:hypothetical protein|nr:ATPase [Bifidobacterium crudilactis]